MPTRPMCCNGSRQSGARFAVMTGDTAYPGGGQNEYGDLQQVGVDTSTVFGPYVLDGSRSIDPGVQRDGQSWLHQRRRPGGELARAERGGSVRR